MSQEETKLGAKEPKRPKGLMNIRKRVEFEKSKKFSRKFIGARSRKQEKRKLVSFDFEKLSTEKDAKEKIVAYTAISQYKEEKRKDTFTPEEENNVMQISSQDHPLMSIDELFSINNEDENPIKS
mmetsp:Transcript_17444/g.17197  ORF Transcript_17444/g.17197 Transcript_17444/m.17197 type:complete len:125 (+) Transcript_17444:14-388(+)